MAVLIGNYYQYIVWSVWLCREVWDEERILVPVCNDRISMSEHWNGSSRSWMGYYIGKMYTSGLESSYIGGGTFLLNSRGFLVFCLWDSSRM